VAQRGAGHRGAALVSSPIALRIVGVILLDSTMDHFIALTREGHDANVTLAEATRTMEGSVRAVETILAALRRISPTAASDQPYRQIVTEFSERLASLQRYSISFSAQRQTLQVQVSEILRRASEQDGTVRERSAQIDRERRALDEKAQACEWMCVSQADKIVFDIGGKRFSIGKHHLSREEGSLFHELFSGELGPNPDEQGVFFLDRSPQAYRYVFDYLRSGPEMFTRPTHPETCELVLKEAEFLRLRGLRNMIASCPMTRRHESIPCPLQPFRNSYYIHKAEWDERKLGYFCSDCGESFIVMHARDSSGVGMGST